MTDWLKDLREEKEQAIARTRGAGPQVAGEVDQAETQLAAIIQGIGIEPLLQQFMDDVLRDHPLFVDSSLNRTVFGRAAGDGLAHEDRESAPWSGPVEGNFLPSALELGGGRTISRVDWRLHLNFRQRHSHQPQLNDILVAASAQGVQVNNEVLAIPTAEKFKTALINAFRESTQPAPLHGVRHKRRRRWYKRLWQSVFPDIHSTGFFLMLVVGVILSLLAVIYVLSSTIGVAPPY
jgi:hypothetical protein